MTSHPSIYWNIQIFESKAEYHGLSVEVVCRTEHCSLVRYENLEFVIQTEDLCFQRSLSCAA